MVKAKFRPVPSRPGLFVLEVAMPCKGRKKGGKKK